jgi:hypothetical protein
MPVIAAASAAVFFRSHDELLTWRSMMKGLQEPGPLDADNVERKGVARELLGIVFKGLRKKCSEALPLESDAKYGFSRRSEEKILDT